MQHGASYCGTTPARAPVSDENAHSRNLKQLFQTLPPSYTSTRVSSLKHRPGSQDYWVLISAWVSCFPWKFLMKLIYIIAELLAPDAAFPMVHQGLFFSRSGSSFILRNLALGSSYSGSFVMSCIIWGHLVFI